MIGDNEYLLRLYTWLLFCCCCCFNKISNIDTVTEATEMCSWQRKLYNWRILKWLWIALNIMVSNFRILNEAIIFYNIDPSFHSSIGLDFFCLCGLILDRETMCLTFRHLLECLFFCIICWKITVVVLVTMSVKSTVLELWPAKQWGRNMTYNTRV